MHLEVREGEERKLASVAFARYLSILGWAGRVPPLNLRVTSSVTRKAGEIHDADLGVVYDDQAMLSVFADAFLGALWRQGDEVVVGRLLTALRAGRAALPGVVGGTAGVGGAAVARSISSAGVIETAALAGAEIERTGGVDARAWEARLGAGPFTGGALAPTPACFLVAKYARGASARIEYIRDAVNALEDHFETLHDGTGEDHVPMGQMKPEDMRPGVGVTEATEPAEGLSKNAAKKAAMKAAKKEKAAQRAESPAPTPKKQEPEEPEFPDPTKVTNFLYERVAADVASGKVKEVITRFPPEPNGYLHIGHAKSMVLNFGLARRHGGRTNLRFDDTNPASEEARYVRAIEEDVKWLGFQWDGPVRHASDNFQQLWDWAKELTQRGLAFVDFDSVEVARGKRGTLTEPGIESEWRNASVEDNLMHFQKMTDGEYEEGHCVLRAKIDMKHSNMNMRDPVLYRILKAAHPQTGDRWVVYPSYDFAHGQCDSLEKISHSVCTLEFEAHRELYDWFQEKLDIFRTPQLEFARFNLTYTVMSKRKFVALVDEGHVDGWDDPRLPTLSAQRRRGVPPAALRDFCLKIGVARRENTIQLALLEQCIRARLNHDAPRTFGILEPIPVIVKGLQPEHATLTAPLHPRRDLGTRTLSLTSNIFMEKEDYMEEPVPGFQRLSPGGFIRLKYGPVVKAVASNPLTVEVVDESTLDKKTLKGIKAVQWLADGVPATFRLYDRLFLTATVGAPTPAETELVRARRGPDADPTDWRQCLNPDSCVERRGLVARDAPTDCAVQFERVGFFVADVHTPGVWNRTVALSDPFVVTETTQSLMDQMEKKRQVDARDKAVRARNAEKAKKQGTEAA